MNASDEWEPKGTALPSLEDDLTYLRGLERARGRAEQLKRRAMRHLKRTKPREKDLSPVARCLLRRIKHLAWFEGHLEDGHATNFLPWPQVALDKVDGEGLKRPTLLFPDGFSESEAFIAAHYLRARVDDCDEAQIGQDVFLCYYAVLRELYTADAPTWAFGGARAGGPGGFETAFVTAQCARSVGHMSQLLASTSSFLLRMAEIAEYSTRVVRSRDPAGLELPEEWCKVERRRVALMSRALFGYYLGRVVLDTTGLVTLLECDDSSVTAPTPNSTLARGLFRMAKSTIERTAVELEVALERIRAFREDREIRRPEPPADGAFPVEHTSMQDMTRRLALSLTAHDYVFGRMTQVLRALRQSIKALNRARDLPVSELLRAAARPFESVSKGIQELLAPVESFTRSTLDRALRMHSNPRDRVDYAELAFAALTSAHVTGAWGNKAYAEALQACCGAVDTNGNLAHGLVFQVRVQGTARHVSNSHALGALSHLIERVDGWPSVKLVDNMIRYFECSGVEISGEGGRAPDVEKQGQDAPSLWSIASCVLALQRTIRMIDRKIDQRVYTHFDVAQPGDLRSVPDIDGLMCTDLGVAAQRAEDSPREMATVVLERMRAQLLGRAARDAAGGKRLCSAILYGPPGTGKTTLAESLARSSKTPLVRITPGDFLELGTEGLERRAASVMEALCLLRSGVILFDEFDSILRRRDTDARRRGTMFEFLTGDMLPRLAALNSAATKRGTAYILATNYIDELDPAAIRQGRFDVRLLISAPDPISRACRLVSQHRKWILTGKKKTGTGRKKKGRVSRLYANRAIKGLASAAQVSSVLLARPGYFTAPRSEKNNHKSSFWRSVTTGLKDGQLFTFAMPIESAFEGAEQIQLILDKPQIVDDSAWRNPFRTEIEIDAAIDRHIVFKLEANLQGIADLKSPGWKRFMQEMKVDMVPLREVRAALRTKLRTQRLELPAPRSRRGESPGGYSAGEDSAGPAAD